MGNDYHFITRWRVEGTADEVFAALADPSRVGFPTPCDGELELLRRRGGAALIALFGVWK